MKFYRAGIRPNYVDTLKNRNQRAMLSKLAREGCRYMKIPKHERICTVCNSAEIEDEKQVLCSKLVKTESSMS